MNRTAVIWHILTPGCQQVTIAGPFTRMNNATMLNNRNQKGTYIQLCSSLLYLYMLVILLLEEEEEADFCGMCHIV